MKTFQDYIAETEEWIDTPVQGDEIDFELAPDSLLVTYVVETVEDGVIIEADDRALALLEQHGVLLETIRTYGAVGRAGTGQTYYEADTADDKHDHEESDWDKDPQQDPKVLAKILSRQNPSDPVGNFLKGGQQLGIFKEKSELDRLQELAGLPVDEDQAADIVAAKELDTDITNPMPGVHEAAEEVEEGMTKQLMHADADKMELEAFVEKYGDEDWVREFWNDINEPLDEAEYHGRKVPLGKPMRGDVKKFKVYVKDPQTGNIKKVNFGHGGTSAKRAGQKTMRIKKSNPDRRRSFRARHHCENPGPRTKARYWSCRAW